MAQRNVSVASSMQRRSAWVASLRSTLPQFAKRSASPLKRGLDAAVLGPTPRRELEAAMGSSSLILPSGWVEQATKKLTGALDGIVPTSHITETDYFLCALIHPTYANAATMPHLSSTVQPRVQQRLRRTVCMPFELGMTAGKSLRFLHELSHFAAQGSAAARARTRDKEQLLRPSVPAEDGSDAPDDAAMSPLRPMFTLEATWPLLPGVEGRHFIRGFRQAHLESLVLYDKTMFTTTGTEAGGNQNDEAVVPTEVSLAAFTALCGSIELVSGWSSFVKFVDIVTRED